MSSRYRLLALDLDGTLLDAHAELPPENIDAVRRAREAGMRVVVCTGRGLSECRRYLRALGQTDPVIVAGGAITADPVSSRTLARVGMDTRLVRSISGVLNEAGHAALLLKDPDATGYDYVVVTGASARIDPVTSWWFEKMSVRVRPARRVEDDEHPGHTVRVGMCADASSSAILAEAVASRFNGEVTLHAFKAVIGAEITGIESRTVHILEVFDAGAGKWPALRSLADRFGIAPDEIAAIGDEINDVGMIRGAGLGVAMGNGVPAVFEVADRVTERHDELGVARAIDRMLEGAW
jgi:hydroxymethylpyrimidine pyrophosphatase-like HAD family hydrolase